jgi:hypothetical protein
MMMMIRTAQRGLAAACKSLAGELNGAAVYYEKHGSLSFW